MHILECLTFHEMPPMWCSAGQHFVPYDDFGNKEGSKSGICKDCARKRLDELNRRKKAER